MALTQKQINARKSRLKEGETIDVKTGGVSNPELDAINARTKEQQKELDATGSILATKKKETPVVTKPKEEGIPESEFGVPASQDKITGQAKQDILSDPTFVDPRTLPGFRRGELTESQLKDLEKLERAEQLAEKDKEAFEKKRQEQLTLADKIREARDKANQQATEIKTEQLQRGGEGIKAILSTGRLGATSSANELAKAGVLSGVAKNLKAIDLRNEERSLLIHQFEQERSRAIELQDLSLANSLSDRIQGVKDEISAARHDKVVQEQKAVSEVKDILTGLETEDQLQSISDETGVAFSTIKMLADQQGLAGKTEREKIERVSQQTAFNNFKSLDPEQVAQIGAAQASHWDTSLGLPLGSTAQFVLGTQKAIKEKGDLRAAQIDNLKAEFDFKVAKTNKEKAEAASALAESSGTGAFSVTQGATNNIPDSLNNPGNIKIGGVGDQFAMRDEAGKLILNDRGEGKFLTFATPQDGFKALLSDLKGKQTGQTRTNLNADSSLLEFAQTYANSGQNYANTIASTAGVSASTPIGQIPTGDFAKGVAKAEGFTGTISGGGQGAFEEFTDVNQALSVIPVQLRNTEKENARFVKGIELGLAQGKTPVEIADVLIGYRVNKPSNFSKNIRSVISLIDDATSGDFSSTAMLINEGKKGQAVRKIENKLLKEQISLTSGDSNENTAKLAFKRGKELNTLIDKFENNFGVITGRLEKFGLKFDDNPEAQKILTKITRMVAQMRNELSGTAVTDSESNFLEPLIPDLKDQFENAKVKINNLQTSPLEEYNARRESVGLSPLNSDQLIDINKRVGLYEGAVSGTPAAVTNITTDSSDDDIINFLQGGTGSDATGAGITNESSDDDILNFLQSQ